MEGQVENIRGFIEHIIFRNEENGYSVFEFIPDTDESDGITCTGCFTAIAPGESMELEGAYVDNPTYGLQFNVVSYSFIRPDSASEMERYLAGGSIKGIGAALAKKIIKKFGDETFRIMEDEPERLAEISGISMRKAQAIGIQMLEKRDIREVAVFLQRFSITPHMALKLYDRYGSDIYSIVRTNPYRLADEIDGIGFRTADRIAMLSGLPPDSEERVASCILYLLGSASGSGHTYLPEPILVRNLLYLIKVPEETYDSAITALSIDRRIVITDPGESVAAASESYQPLPDQLPENPYAASTRRIYLRRFYSAEKKVAGRLLAMKGLSGVSPGTAAREIIGVEKDQGIELDEKQRQAVIEAAVNRFFVLTGGPGTGKTTTLRVMIRYFERRGDIVSLAAPTGRAAKRMSEATGRPAKTIHRLLEVQGISQNESRQGAAAFAKNETEPLECDVVIIDEASMVDIFLFGALVSAIPEDCSLILVGDRNQLPSVGPGNVLKDILRSERFPSVYLDTIFRQEGESDIVRNAHLINEGKEVTLDNKSEDFFFMERRDADSVISSLIPLMKGKLSDYVGCSPGDIQVLCPSKSGNAGVPALNTVLQESLNPASEEKREHRYGSRIFRTGDKVMQMKNDYRLHWSVYGAGGVELSSGDGIFNGDIGKIENVYPELQMMRVIFDEERCVDYPFRDLENLDLAYAVTIHKSQGSEYPAVVIPVLPVAKQLLNRNLLYTAVTRAKKCVVLIGRKETFRMMERNVSVDVRYSGLCDMLEKNAKRFS